VITAAGVSAGIDMALTLVARIAGEQVAQPIQLSIEYDPRAAVSRGLTRKGLTRGDRAGPKGGGPSPRDAVTRLRGAHHRMSRGLHMRCEAASTQPAERRNCSSRSANPGAAATKCPAPGAIIRWAPRAVTTASHIRSTAAW
jgi:hypothetical protein